MAWDFVCQVYPFARVTDENRAKATIAVEELRSGGGTNLWDGIKTSLDEIWKLKSGTSYCSVDKIKTSPHKY